MDSSQLIQLANEEGFELAGVTSADPPQHVKSYKRWLASGFHGEMEYMERHEELRQDPKLLLPSCRSILAVGLNYLQEPNHLPGEPKIARYALGKDYHKVIRKKLKRVEAHLPRGTESRICVDSAPLLEREIASRAGLGWIGKNTMLIDSHRGSWFLLGFLLTSLEFESSVPAKGGCGKCRACIDACPTGAIVLHQSEWQVDSRKCISYLTIEKRGDFQTTESASIQDWTFGCDVCQEVCPFNQPRENQPQRAQITSEGSFLRRRTWPGLSELTQMEETDWDERTQGSAVRRAGYDGLKRNAQANLDNQKS